MVSIVLASHGDLAAGIKQTGSMVFGDQPSVAVVSLEPSMGPDDFRAKVEEAIASFEDRSRCSSSLICGAARRSTRLAGSSRGHDSGLSSPVSTCLCSSRHIRSAFDAKNTAHAIAKHLVTEAKAGVRVKPESLEPEEKKPAAAAAAPAGAIPPGTVIGDGQSRLPTSVSTPVCCMVRWPPRGPSRSTPTASSWFPTALLTTSSARP